MVRTLHTTIALSLALLLLLSLSAGCATGGKLRGQAKEIEALTEEIHDRAYRCAPEELAIAEASVAFGFYELDQGAFTRAREHIYRAEVYTRRADELSDYPECLDQVVDIEVEATPTVEVKEVEATPTDRDGDGLLDDDDSCPDDPEDLDGFEDEDGCPDTDNDQDGVPDLVDSCPNVAEDLDGFLDQDGCPDIDNDSDGIVDINDQCRDRPEDFDGFQDKDGCADEDNDEDGLLDDVDQCPNEAEDYDGDVDSDGCPEERKLVEVREERIQLNEKVHFETAKSEILPQSYPLLNEVAEVLLANQTIRIRIEGHTDSRGSDRYNQQLSEERAASVRSYLIGRGVDAARIASQGFGEERPIEDNTTEAGRAANRRVEVHITQR